MEEWKVTEGEKESKRKSPVAEFTPQMPAAARVGPGQSHSITRSLFPMWVT